MSKVTAIDLVALKREAFAGEGETVEISRAWLQSVYHALQGEPFADPSEGDAPAVRQARILAALDHSLSAGATA